jgi:hypothetical protein
LTRIGADLSAYTEPLNVTEQGPQDGSGNFIAPNPFGVGGSQSIDKADGTVDPLKTYISFISMTNIIRQLL